MCFTVAGVIESLQSLNPIESIEFIDVITIHAFTNSVAMTQL